MSTIHQNPDRYPGDGRDTVRNGDVRVVAFEPKRSRLPGLIGAGILGAVLAGYVISSFYDPRSIGTKLDAGVEAASATIDNKTTALRGAASEAAQGAALATDRVAESLGDAGITAAVKTALAADPALSALKIAVTTREGVVHLEGPAPDQKARDRAEVLAAAPAGVVSVDNRLVVPGTTHVN